MKGSDDAGAEPFAYRYHLLRAATARYQRAPARLEAGELAEIRRQAQRSLTLEGRVLATPEAAAVSPSQAELDAALAEIAERYADPAELADDLARNGLDEATLRAGLRRELTFDAVMRRIGANHAAVTDEEVVAFYEAAPERFRRPERRAARHILITINEGFVENQRPAAQARIDALEARLRERPQAFADLARRHSECPTALEGGRLGVLERGQLYPELDAVVFALDEGAVSAPVESQVGLHLLLCERIEPSCTLPLARVRDRIRAHLAERRRRAAQRAWLEGLPGDSETVAPDPV